MDTDPVTPDAFQTRRDERLLMVLRVVTVLGTLGTVSAVPGLWNGVPEAFAGLVFLTGSYGVTWAVAARGRFELARNLLFSLWVTYLALQLAMYRPEALFGLLFATISTAFASLILVGMVVLERWSRARWWVGAGLAAYLVPGVIVGLRFHTQDAEQARLWFTSIGVSWMLLVAVGGFALLFASDLAQALRVSADRLRDANEANEAKSRFLANMSHELRTPLTAILGYVELLDEEAGGPEFADFRADLTRIRSSANHLHELIGDVLDLSKIEAGHVELYPTDCDVKDMVTEVANSTRPLAERRGNTLELVVGRVPPTIRTDEGRLRQVLVNLLSNANKFTEGGQVHLVVDTFGDRLRFEVRDTGIGIPEDKQQAVFLPFVQADDSATRRFGGTGLGLAISRHLVRLLGGELTLRSQVGRGTTFAFDLPR